MKRSLGFFLTVILLFGSLPLFAQLSGQDIPSNIRNNTYFLESVRLTNLANLAFMDGEYLASYEYSEEAIRYAALSDEYVLLQLKIRETDNAIAAARSRLDFAESVNVNASVRYPSEYQTAQSAFTEARNHRAGERWDDAIDAANRVLAALAGITEMPPVVAPPPVIVAQPPVTPPPPPPPQQVTLPSQYTVRPWALSRDCFWNIAGWPWVYNDPNKWRILYEANRNKIPDPNNPNLIHPGMVMDIPSISGETRQGMWDTNTVYPTYE